MLTALLWLALPAYCGAGEALRLSFKEGVLGVLENNLDISIERVGPRIADGRVQSEEGAFDPEAFGSFRREDAESPLSARSSIAAGGLASLKSETYGFNTGITGTARLGTQYTLEVRDDWTADTLNRFQYQYTSFTGVSIIQPLLKNSGYDANTLDINIAKKNRDISVHRLEKTISDTVSGYGFAYWDLVRVREELKVRVESQNLAQALYEINKKKLDAGAISELEVTQAQAAASTRTDDVLTARKAVSDKENELKLFISRDVFALRDVEIVPQDAEAARPFTGALEQSVSTVLSRRPDYLEARSELEKNNIRIRYSSNQRYPKVDIEASYGYNGLGESFKDSFTGIDSNPQWAVGLVFRYPLGNNAALGSFRAARLEADQSLLRLKKLEQQIILAVDNSIKDIKADSERVEAARVSTALSEESLRAEEKKMAAGRSTTYDVLKVQEDLARARSNEITAIADYNKSIINYYRETGGLLEELGIRMKAEPAPAY